MTVDEAVAGVLRAQGDMGIDDAAVVVTDRAGETAAGRHPRPALAERDRAGLPDAAQLLRVTLEMAANEGKVLVDPDVHAAAVDGVAVHAAHDHERFLVLRADGVVELAAVVAAALPIGEDHRHRARVVVVGYQRQRLGQQLGDARRVGSVLHGQQVAAVVPRHVRQDRGPTQLGAGKDEAVHVRHGRPL